MKTRIPTILSHALLSAFLAIGLTACNDKETTSQNSSSKTTEKASDDQKEQEKKKSDSKKDKKSKKEVIYTYPPLTIQKQEQVLLETKQGTMRYLGYAIDEEDQYLLAIRFEGKLTEAMKNNFSIKVILEDRNLGRNGPCKYYTYRRWRNSSISIRNSGPGEKNRSIGCRIPKI